MAWLPLGWECVAVAEVDAAASSVLAYRHPYVPNLGDVTKITESTIAGLGQIDLVVFGSPCQDLSVAGKRAGLSGARSGLFHTAVGIVRWARKHGGCRFALWENVPGAFSSHEGRDFAVVVGALAGLRHVDVPEQGWGSEGCALGDDGLLEWSTLDAQWFGVAQRRRRVFALADFGAWADRGPILLEPQSLRGDSPPRREQGKGATTDVAPSLTSSMRGTGRVGDTRGQDPVVAVPAEGCWWDGRQVSQTLDAVLSKGQAMPEKNRFPAVPQPTYAIQAGALRTNPASGPDGVGVQADVSYTLEARAEVQCVAFSCKDHGADAGPIAPTLRAMNHSGSHANAGGQVAVAWALGSHSGAADGETTNQSHSGGGPVGSNISEELAYSLRAGRTQGVAVAFNARQDPDSWGERTGPLDTDGSAQAVCVTGDVTHTLRAEGFDASEDGTGRGQPIVAGYMPARTLAKDGGVDSRFAERDVCDALHTSSGGGNKAPLIASAYGFQPRIGRNGRGDMGDAVNALTAQAGETGKGDAAPCVAMAFQDRFRGDDGRGYDRPPPLSVDQVGTLETVKPWNVAMSMAVRRLTPLECERLQGFPDLYTRIPVRRYATRRISKARPADYWECIDGAWWLMMADGPRYKMLGNSMAVPCMAWIGRAIDAAVRGAA